jgi:hypothetical protein
MNGLNYPDIRRHIEETWVKAMTSQDDESKLKELMDYIEWFAVTIRKKVNDLKNYYNINDVYPFR